MLVEEKFASKHLGMEVTYRKEDIIDGDAIITLISHESLKDILLNQVPSDLGIQYTFNVIKSELNHSVVICVITDNTGRRIEALGESTLPTLTTEISRNYPTTMAKKRAFDQAVIDYIGMPGKVYSDVQIDLCYSSSVTPVVDYSLDNEVSSDTIITTDLHGVVKDDAYCDCDEEHTETIVSNDGDDLTDESHDGSPIFNPSELDDDSSKLKTIGDTVFNLTGTYKDKRFTIAQIYEMDYKYFCNVVKLTSRSEEIQKQVNLMKEYQKIKENKE